MLIAFIDWCQPITDRLVANYRGYWRRYRWLICATLIAAFGDFVSTIHFIRLDGIHHELHPAIRIVSAFLGPLLGPLLGKAAQLSAIFLVTLYARRVAPYVFVAASMMYGWATWYNAWGRDLYSPLLFELLPL